ncbi:MAG: Ubiquinone biosynthesis O-methyltransferase [Syntrophomonadaceae bacterium]|nr:Ubiquinone biosynthesis O-methyltransferase [Bacillota bacterium]
MKLPDSNYYDRAWQQARQNSSLCSMEKDPAAWQIFWDLFSPSYLKICRALRPACRAMASYWKEEGIFDQKSRILDIGCGPGTFALPLGEIAEEVAALDTSAGMLEMLRSDASKEKVNNIHPIQADWDNFQWKKNYDFVLAANSPAINSYQTLMKMNEVSSSYCMLICSAGKVSPTLRHLLWEEIMGEKLQGNAFDISFPFNILYLEGYFPHLSFEEQQYSYLEEAETVLQNYRAYFKIFGKEGRAVDKVLKKCIQTRSVKECIEEKVTYKLAVMWWNVKEKQKR